MHICMLSDASTELRCSLAAVFCKEVSIWRNADNVPMNNVHLRLLPIQNMSLSLVAVQRSLRYNGPSTPFK